MFKLFALNIFFRLVPNFTNTITAAVYYYNDNEISKLSDILIL